MDPVRQNASKTAGAGAEQVPGPCNMCTIVEIPQYLGAFSGLCKLYRGLYRGVLQGLLRGMLGVQTVAHACM